MSQRESRESESGPERMASHLSACLDIALLNSYIHPYFVAKRQNTPSLSDSLYVLVDDFNHGSSLGVTLLSANIRYCFTCYGKRTKWFQEPYNPTTEKFGIIMEPKA